MTPDLRALILPLSWFPPPTDLFGEPMRSLSLCSHHALRVMGLHLLERGHEYADPLDEMGEVLAFAWLHTAPITEISAALWSGTWRDRMQYRESSPAATLALLAEWREYRERLLTLLDVSRIKVLPRKSSGKEETPSSVIAPTLLAHQIAHVAELLTESLDHVCWHLPVWQAWQIYHVAIRRGGGWTAPDVAGTTIVDNFADFQVEALTPPE